MRKLLVSAPWKGIIPLLGLILLLGACGTPRPPVENYPPLHKIAVLPFEPVCPGQRGDEITCAFADKLTPGDVSAQGAQVLTTLLYQRLKGNPLFYLVPENAALGLWAEVLSEDTAARSFRLIARIGQKLGVDAVLYGKVFRYIERKGRGFAVVRPASVAFALILVRSKDAKVIWEGWFDETQRPLFENILAIRLYRDIRWLTAKELAERGLDKVLKGFPYLKFRK